jgi:hypothetical protein
MSIDLFMNDTCPKCRKPITRRTVAPHRTRHDLEIHNFECADCGLVKSKILLRKPSGSPSLVTALRIVR